MKPIFTALAIITCIIFFFGYLFFNDKILWEAVATLIALTFYAVSPCTLLLDRDGVPTMDNVN
ncbi:MAG: hypothetical protein J6Z28_08170 [Succinivibrio sp.]|nr:hypothetical protein [Succinivibrio sp.]